MQRTARLATITVVLGGLTVTACSSDATKSRPSVSSTATGTRNPSKRVGVNDFAAAVARAGVVTINVHVPVDGSIDGTDLTIPYTDIATSKALPKDLSTPLAVYCRSGNMSAQAVADLQRLGYTDITELDGGYNAWTAAGRSLTPS